MNRQRTCGVKWQDGDGHEYTCVLDKQQTPHCTEREDGQSVDKAHADESESVQSDE